jgi:ABC transporter with metal-binding/Fe-S-binding domain ATP-binding protein
MKIAVLFSGGKDSVFAAFCCIYRGWEVELLTIEPAEYSTMFHHPNVDWCSAQAEAMGLPITIVRARGKTEADELLEIKHALAGMKVDGVAAGAIESEYQKERIDKIAHELGIRSFAPIWRTGKANLDEICRYFEAHIIAVSAEGLGERDLGAKFDDNFLRKLSGLRIPVSPHLEGGEGETFVTYAPFFKKRLRIGKMEKTFAGSGGIARIVELS